MEFLSPWIHTTERCNLRCHYCYVKGEEDMSPEVYDALEDLLLKSRVERKHLRFAGGEPLLVFNIWRPFAERMLKHKGTVIEVLTNLVSVPKNFWTFAELENVNISVSLDNGEKYKVLNRETVEKIARLRCPWIMTTITKENIDKLDVMAAFVGSNNYGWALTTDYFGDTVPEWEDLAASLYNIADILRQFNYDFTRISFNNFSVKHGFTGCRAGKEMFTVACNGDIYKCQTLIGCAKPIGNVFEGYKIEEPCRRKQCKGCPIEGLCSGWCPIHFKLPNNMCNVIKIFAKEVLKEVRDAK